MWTINKYLMGICSLFILFVIDHSTFGQGKISNNSDLPNIVLIMADDMGYECLGVNGSVEYNTPNLDQLASRGIQFENTFSQPLCTPSRVKIMTGLHNFRNYEDFTYLNPNQTTFGNLLKEAGYATCIAGKWQLNGVETNRKGNQDVTRPNHFGFDEYSLWQLVHPRGKGERYANPLITQNGKDLPRNKDAYGPDVFTNFITDFIDRKATTGQPFLVYYPMVLPHSPFVPTPDSPEWKDPSNRYKKDTAYFADMVSHVDKMVGKIVAELKEKGVWENTILIFTGDNGTHSSIVTETVDRKVIGGKGKTINTGNHIPMIITWPKEIKKGRVYQGVLDFSDILPTLADAAEVNSYSYKTDGKSFLSVLKGYDNPIKNEAFIHYTPRNGEKAPRLRWVMDGSYKLYQDGKFYNTIIDLNENNALLNLTLKEQKIKNNFETVLESKEKEFPFNWNNKKFIPEENRDNY